MWCIFLIYTGNVQYSAGLEASPDRNLTCGVDFSPIAPVYEGVARLETYPWLGTLVYPVGKSVATTVVVLVTKQLVIGSANEIDAIPKDYFRARSRVVLGSNCTGPSIKVRDYTYHHEYEANTYSALALIQLNLDDVAIDLFPICGPPSHLIEARFFSLVLNEDCEKPIVTIYEMEYVDMNQCKQFYRRSGLTVDRFWPRHATCARAVGGPSCVWRAGAVLATKMGGLWHLLGFGVYGPGCHAPARFLEYGVYRNWVKKNVARMGTPAITRVGPDHVIMRRKLSSIQRFGECDREELEKELYTDTFTFSEEKVTSQFRKVRYNLTIMESVEYSCVTFRVYNKFFDKTKPKLHLRRWCSKPLGMCSGLQMIRIDFYVEIQFMSSMVFKLGAYGQARRVMDVRRLTKYENDGIDLPHIPDRVYFPKEKKDKG